MRNHMERDCGVGNAHELKGYGSSEAGEVSRSFRARKNTADVTARTAGGPRPGKFPGIQNQIAYS